jgi:hypothetical protein
VEDPSAAIKPFKCPGEVGRYPF